MPYSEQIGPNLRRCPDEELLRTEARALFVQLLDQPSDKLNREIAQWRQQGPEYESAFCKIESLWRATQQSAREIAQQEHQALACYLASAEKTSRKHRRWIPLGAMCVLCSVLLSAGVWLENPGIMQQLWADNYTERGQQKTVTLPDGSTALMDADSALKLAFTPKQRHIGLLRGAAFFSVKHADLPFTVSAGNGLISVTGTRFIVRRLNKATQVTVEHGHVNVSVNHKAQPIPLSAGQQVTFNDEGAQPTQNVDTEQMLDWTNGRYVFYQQRFDDVISEIERYHSGRILIMNPTLAQQKISGSLDLDNPEKALNSLQGSLSFKLTRIASPLTVISL